MSLSRMYGTAKLVTASSFLQRQFRVFLALMLCVVLFQTAPAGDLPIQRGHGSAFSAATYDVALPVRRDSAEVTGPAPVPLLAMAPARFAAVGYDSPVAAKAPLPPRQTGPPAPPPRLHVASPRAPPVQS